MRISDWSSDVCSSDLVIPVGGNHVTSDIARGLSTPLVHAERMKTLYGHVITAPTDERELIDVPQVGEDDSSHSQQIPSSLLVGIIQPRVERSEEHTSELQSLMRISYAVFCLKKKKYRNIIHTDNQPIRPEQDTMRRI